MKKFLMLLLVVVMIVPASSVCAYKIGDVIGSSLVTDIVAQINGYDIASFNYQGYTYVVAEDLANYGFSVQYDNATRSLGVYRNYGATNIYSTYTKPAVSSNELGKVAFQILYTDIVTYLDGSYVNSYNINGKTIICFNDLAKYGSLNYDNSTRKITLEIAGIARKTVSSYTSSAYYPGTYIPTYTSVTGVPLKRQDVLSSGTPLYVYSYTDSSDVGDYWRALVRDGWTSFKGDDKSTINKFESSYVKGSDLIIINVYFDFDEVWIVN